MSALFLPDDDLVPDPLRLVGIRHFRLDDGPASGQRLIRVETAAGLDVELWPDRGLDLGQVRHRGVPFGWTGPIGMADPARLRTNQPLSGLLSTCGFDHIRQPETDGGRAYPLHGAMMHQPATLLMAAPVVENGETICRIEAEVTQYSLDQGGIRLRRRIDLPLTRAEIRLTDEVRVLAGQIAVMAMYHVNLGYPLSAPGMRLELNGEDVGQPCLQDGIRTRPSGAGAQARAVLTSPWGRFTLDYDAGALPVFQTLRDGRPGVNLLCLEPATHDRLPRAALREAGALRPTPRGGTHRFSLAMAFDAGPWA